MKKLIFVLALVLSQKIFCQDSIYKKNGEIIASKILEINSTQVKFKKSNNLGGPSYSELKSELVYIKFENGTIDTINKATTAGTEVKDTVTVIKYAKREPFLYGDMGDKEIFSMIEALPSSVTKNKLRREYFDMKRYREQQYLSGSLGWVVGFGVPVVVTYMTLVNSASYNTSQYDPVTVIVVGALAGAAIRITGQVLFKVNKNKRKQARRNLMSIYNGIN